MDVPLWLGSHANYQDYLRKSAQVEMGFSADVPVSADNDSYQVFGNVGVVDVKGPLTNSDSVWNRMFGLTSYNSIRNNLISAAEDSKVKAIVLNIDSGGGSPNGLMDTAAVIRQISQAKPVVSYTGGYMASAAYAVGSAADQIFAGPMAHVGSIGTIATVMDYTKRMEQEGVTPHVIRSGPKKALGGPNEPLTPEAEAEIKSQVDYLSQVFMELVADHRGMSVADVQSRYGHGGEFIGEQALQAGLIDGVTTLDALVGGLQRKIDMETQRKDPIMPKKQLLTERQVALMANGLTLEQVMDPALAEDPAPPEVTAEVETPEIEAAATPEVPAEAPTPEPTLTAYLQTELAAKSQEVTKLAVQLAEQERELNTYKAHHGDLLKIVAASINRMQIGLGGKPVDLSSTSVDALLTQHAQVQTEFNQTFPVGGKYTLDATDQPPAPLVDPMAKARLRAVRT